MTEARLGELRMTRRRLLAVALTVAACAVMPASVRLRALRVAAATAFGFTDHERSVLHAAADTVIPGGTVLTRAGSRVVPSAGASGAVDYVENLLSGAVLYAAGVRRPPYVPLPAGAVAAVFPRTGTNTLWTAKRIAWYGDPLPRPTRPNAWPSELERLQALYRAGIAALDAAVAPLRFDDIAAAPLREPVLRTLQAGEAAQTFGHGETGEPFFHTFLGHLAEACFGDPVYGGNRDWVYWEMCGFTGPSFIADAGPVPGNGWTAEQMTSGFSRT
jgi:gluconate 2-dehydrogenase subunit 3-like protein